MDYEQTLARLCSLPGPSGFEGPASRAAAELLRPWMDEVTVDKMGNVVGVRRCGDVYKRQLEVLHQRPAV